MTRNIPLNLVQFSPLAGRVEIQRVMARIKVSVNRRKHPELAVEKCLLYSPVPFDGVEYADRALGLDQAVRKRAYRMQVLFVILGH